MTGIPDVDGVTPLNWIRSGTLDNQNWPSQSDYSGDEEQVYETVLNGTFAPWKMASHADSVMSPTWEKFKSLNDLENLAVLILLLQVIKIIGQDVQSLRLVTILCQQWEMQKGLILE